MPRRRRARGEGSVFQRKDGRWVVQVETDDGRKTVYVKSQKEGVRKLRELQNEIEKGTLPTGPDQTVKQYLEYWIEEVHKSKVKVSTYVKYRKLIYSYIIPILGDTKLQKLTPQQINSLYRKKEQDGLTSKTIHSIHGVLHKALDDAMKWRYVSYNVCSTVSPPRIVKSEIQPLTIDQVERLFHVARGSRLEALVVLAALTGMRRGELLALRWSDVDFENETLQVRRTVDFIPKYGYVENAPKTQAGKRILALPSLVMDALRAHRFRQLEQKLKAGAAWEGRDLVFTDLQGGYFSPRYLDKLFKKLLADGRLPPIRFHDLRHSTATILLHLGVDIKVIQEILGHSNIAMTADVYSHVSVTMQKMAMEKWNTAFKRDDDGAQKMAGL